MVPETTSFFKSQDQSQVYRKKYKERHDVKLLRMSNNIKKIKDLMKKQKRDDERGATYGAGTALDIETSPNTSSRPKRRRMSSQYIHQLSTGSGRARFNSKGSSIDFKIKDSS